MPSILTGYHQTKRKTEKKILKTDFSSDFKRSAQKLLVVVSLLKIERKIKKENLFQKSFLVFNYIDRFEK